MHEKQVRDKIEWCGKKTWCNEMWLIKNYFVHIKMPQQDFFLSFWILIMYYSLLYFSIAAQIAQVTKPVWMSG